jgi:hypothetical protein
MIRFGTSIAGAAGFVLMFGLGMALDRDWGRITLTATIAALAFGLLAHWWMTLWLISLRSAQQEQARQQAVQMKEAAKEAAIQDDVEPAPEAPVS